MTDLELNKAVTEAYKVPEYAYVTTTNGVGDFTLNSTPLYQDHSKLFELCVEHGISIAMSKQTFVYCMFYKKQKSLFSLQEERFEDHTSKLEATCIAMLKALATKAGIEYD